MSTVDDLRIKAIRLHDEAKEANVKLRFALIADYPLKVGTAVIGQNYRGATLRGKIVRIEVTEGYGGPKSWKAYPIVALLKKDGSAGMREVPSWRDIDWNPDQS